MFRRSRRWLRRNSDSIRVVVIALVVTALAVAFYPFLLEISVRSE